MEQLSLEFEVEGQEHTIYLTREDVEGLKFYFLGCESWVDHPNGSSLQAIYKALKDITREG